MFSGDTAWVERAAFTPDGTRVISCAAPGDRTVRLWDAATGRRIYCSDPFGQGFLCVAPLPDGRHCLTSGKDGLVWLWEWKK